MIRLPRSLRWRLLRGRYGGAEAARRLGATVGQGCRILSFQTGQEPWLIRIGDRVTISSDVLLLTHDGTGWLFRDEKGRRFRYRPITVGSDVFIGARAILMPGVKVGDRCVIGAGAVVTRSVPSGAVVGGNPARIVGRFEDLEKRALDSWRSASPELSTSYRDHVTALLDETPAPPLSN